MHSDLPKVLHRLAGKTLLAHVLDAARSLSPSRICVVVGHGAGKVRERIRDSDVLWVLQEPQLGTAHALAQAFPSLEPAGIALMLYGDVPLMESPPPAAAHECLGVNSPSDLAGLERHFQMNESAKLLESGVILADPARIDVRGELTCGRDVSIDVNCIFEGRVALGDGVRVGANCILRDVTIGAGSEAKPFSLLEEAAIGANSRIGPYARIRPGTAIADDVHVGNFVEVKASSLGRGSKANHLAYVGDSTVGADVNIGAGTITCNYDGAHKHRTVIEDDVHIGSDVQLVAPVTVGKGATIGAGATITRDVPPGGLTLTEKKQVTRPEWKRPRKK